MISCKFFGSLSLATLFAFGCGGEPRTNTLGDVPAFNLEATRAIVSQESKQYLDALVTGDIAAIDPTFTSDARMYPPGAAAVVGLPAIHASILQFMKVGITEFREQSTAFHGSSEFVFDEGTYTMTYGKAVTERGKYLHVWKHVGERWRIDAMMWNTDAPVPESK